MGEGSIHNNTSPVAPFIMIQIKVSKFGMRVMFLFADIWWVIIKPVIYRFIFKILPVSLKSSSAFWSNCTPKSSIPVCSSCVCAS